MKKESRSQNGSRFLVWAALLVLIIVSIPFIDWLMGLMPPIQPVPFPLIVFLALAALLVAVNLHELGHFWVGRALGYRLISYRIGFLCWSYENGAMKLQLIRNRGYGGLCAMTPPDKELRPFGYTLFYGGGILMNGLTGALSILLAVKASWIPGPWTVFLLILGIISVYSAALNLFPVMSMNQPSDGKLVWGQLFHRPYVKKLIRAQQTAARLSAGVRPRDLILPAVTWTDSPQLYDLSGLVHRYFHALDARDYAAMGDLADRLQKNLDQLPPVMLPPVLYELCFMGCVTGNGERARTYYEKAGKILQSDQDVNGLRIKAYYEYYVNHQEKTALALCEKALTVAHLFPIKGQAVMERELIEELADKIANPSDPLISKSPWETPITPKEGEFE